MPKKSKAISRMTKAELLHFANKLSQESDELKLKLENLQKSHQAANEELDDLRQKLHQTTEGSQSLTISSGSEAAENSQDSDNERYHELIEKHKILEKEHSELMGHYEEIRKLLIRNRDNFSELKMKFDRLLEVKKSLSDKDKYGQILIDYRYYIRFISENALEKLQNKELYNLVDHKVFKLFDYDNGIIVKKQIDKVLLKKKDKALSDVLCRVSEGEKASLKGELQATSYENKPAVLFVFQ
jgi:hypothetical protein